MTICIKIFAKTRGHIHEWKPGQITKVFWRIGWLWIWNVLIEAFFCFLSFGIVIEFNKINVTLAKIHSSLLQEKCKMQTLDCLTNKFHVAWVRSVIDHRRRQNVVRTKRWQGTRANSRVRHWCCRHIISLFSVVAFVMMVAMTTFSGACQRCYTTSLRGQTINLVSLYQQDLWPTLHKGIQWTYHLSSPKFPSNAWLRNVPLSFQLSFVPLSFK